MKKELIYYLFVLLCIFSCSDDEKIGTVSDEVIRIELSDAAITTRAMQFNTYDDIIAEGSFSLDAVLAGNNRSYIHDSWVYFFNGNWRFRDVVNQGNLIDFYWPNDNDVNFVAFIPRCDANTVVKREDISFNETDGVTFSCELPAVINDRTDAETVAEHSRREFAYACRRDQNKEGGKVRLHFVHPFAVINFHLFQSHRDLTIHSITLKGLSNSGTYKNTSDTYETYLENQSSLTYSHWLETGNNDTFTVNIEKSIPEELNYDSHIGGPYLVIPQILDDVKLTLNYSWDTVDHGNTAEFAISTESVPAWQPGKSYTYLIDLGDNKEEIIFKVLVEEWDKGEDDDYENSFEVK